MRKYKSSKNQNKTNTKKKKSFDGCSLKRLCSPLNYFLIWRQK